MKTQKFHSCLGAFLLAVSSLVSCQRETVPVSDFIPYISAYTSGLIYPSSTIRIELAEKQDAMEANTEISESLFSFSPSVKGKAHWINNRTIEFVPENGALRSGQTYEAQFKLGKVIKVDKRLKIFPFSFKVENKNADIRMEMPEISDPAVVTVRGEIRFSDAVEQASVEKAFSAQTSDKQSLSPVIEATDDMKIFRFIITDIQRGKTETSLEVRLDGKPLGIPQAVSRSIDIPVLDVFKVLSVEQISEPENGIQITFTDPVSKTQDMKGLIIVTGPTRFTIHAQNNKVNLYFDRKGVNQVTVTVDRGVKNTQGKNLEAPFTAAITIEELKPAVELLSDGNILPNTEHLLLPFRAVNLHAVDIKVIKIYENNVLMFLQDNDLNGSQNLRRSGRLVYKKTLRLDAGSTQSIHNWRNYSVDLSQMLRREPGAIYRIEFSFKQAYSAYPCGEADADDVSQLSSDALTSITPENIGEKEEAFWDNPYPSYYINDYDWDVYEWKERDNPCHPSYYMVEDRRVACNVMTSDLGLIAKANSGNQWWIAVNSLSDTQPVANANLTFYNYQLQSLGSVKTDGDGFAAFTPNGKPFVVIAEAGGQKTYLRLVDGYDNSLSRFDVGGKAIEKGLKGFIYGERGVWRPGDTLHVGFILYDPEKRIPAGHPVTLEMYNPRGQFHSKQILTGGVNGFYAYAVPTQADDPTGLWNAYIRLGGTSFHKSFRIETIKPNRLKINLAIPGNRLDASAGNIPATLSSAWLTGSSAHHLKAKVEMTLTKTKTQFKAYEKYIFNNPATDFYASQSDVFEGTLNDAGEARFNFKVPKAEEAPGMLNANVVCRVFEPGGDASIYTESLPFSPFSSYVGLNLNQESGKYIETDTSHRFDIVTVNADGKLVNRNNLEYKIYRVGWSWWWENNDESFSGYINNSSYQPVAGGKLQTVGGKTNFQFKVKYPDWGRYLVYVTDKESGHSTGGTVFVDWPEWQGRSKKSDPENIKMLTFTTDKTSYEIGEDITVIIPAAAGGKALLALENGSAILNRTWISVSDRGDTKYTFKATKEMAPNFYIHISLLQPHSQRVNDLPIRMYGVMPVLISNRESVLEPRIAMPDVLRPETEFTVEVSEKQGKAMTYTLAIVDDGLLDLTNFKTPDPWNEFYAREALGIRTWDMYDYVMGAFGGKYTGMFSVGGDENLKPTDEKANRFKPIVKYLGPFALSKGGKQKHSITLPVYVGSVRTMIVAGEDGAYGKAEKTTPVRTPLMALSSLPRIIGTNEEITLPVNVFAMEASVKDVAVKVETTGLLQNTESVQSLRFNWPGDEMVYFALKTGGKTGIEKVTVTATGGGKTTKETIEIEVRNPNPAIILSESKLLNADETGEFNYRLTGSSNDDWVKLEISRIPSVDITRRFDFLYNYEHNCSEQLVSRALPLLFVSQFKEMDKDEAESIRLNVREAIKNLYGRQLTNGGIVYWPGQSSADDWITGYAGSFLVLAKEKGYEVNPAVLNKWKSRQKKEVLNWSPAAGNNYYVKESEFQQAYRLYSLALAGSPESGAMNRLKERKELSTQTRWLLAAAYALTGKNKPAEDLIFNIPTDITPYRNSYAYGSSARDEAMILETLVLMGRLEDAFKQAQKIAQALSEENSFSTQSTAYALMAMGMLAEKTSGSIDCRWALNDKKQDEIHSAKAVWQKQLPNKPANGSVSLANNGKGVLYVNLVSKSRPVNDTLSAVSNHLKLDVSYTDLSGKAIDVSELRQGTDFIASVKVSNISISDNYADLALTQIIPSGWEIFNERMTDTENTAGKTNSYAYRDIRDDRVLTYFDLPRGKSKTFAVRLQATYSGSFVLPALHCEAMYDPSTQARTTARRVKVVR
ncbi:MAG: alpha-2-macroglobulin [Dysgonamonadaceae bacterium]|jgi:uncharacterized protein YfaS (alpha-2-macroglobulin family)|nr:alpha-2-macroglobulin [Dysgonamonadaceae bacterium]